MSNVLTIAQKELRSYFVSPIAYVVIGLFAVLFGVFFISSLSFILRVSLQAGMMQGAPPININEYMIRPLFGNTGVIMLFVLPMITMRSYAEEKRSGNHRAAAVIAADRHADHSREVLGRRDLVRNDAGSHCHPHGLPLLLR